MTHRKPSLRTMENRIRRQPGRVWFELLPFINNDVLIRWAIVHRRNNP